MRILVAIHNAYTDFTSGAAHSVRVLTEWLANAGHECRVLATARFDARPPDDIESHLAQLGVPVEKRAAAKDFVRSVRKPKNVVPGRPTAHFTLAGVPVTMLLTRHNQVDRPDRLEAEQFLYAFGHLFTSFAPDVVRGYGGHPAVQEAMRRARERGAITVFSLHNYGYEDRTWFQHVDHVLTCSPYLSRYYRERLGLVSTGIPSPIEWSTVVAPVESRAFVTFVHPALHKGAAVFARLADMLGSRRPDIPILVVESAAGAGGLNSFGLDFTSYPQIMVAPPVPRPADYFALTKILLMPSVFNEPFGRVAAEAMINGIPPLVSDRGALPETVGGVGQVLPIPAGLTPASLWLPTPEEIEPWFNAVCDLWDRPDRYEEMSGQARRAAERLYGESVLRQRYLEYFAHLTPGGRVFAEEDAGVAHRDMGPG